MKYVRSKQPGIKTSHKGNPSFELKFESEPLLVDDSVADFLIQNPRFEIVNKPIPEGSKPESNEDFQKELDSIKGIGKKTVKDIIIVYPSKESLIEAINRDDHIPFEDSIVDKLKNKYGGD